MGDSFYLWGIILHGEKPWLGFKRSAIRSRGALVLMCLVGLSGLAAAGETVVPRITARLTAQDIGLVINLNDPYSVQVGNFYIEARKLLPSQVLRVELPVRAELSVDEFQALDKRV